MFKDRGTKRERSKKAKYWGEKERERVNESEEEEERHQFIVRYK